MKHSLLPIKGKIHIFPLMIHFERDITEFLYIKQEVLHLIYFKIH